MARPKMVVVRPKVLAVKRELEANIEPFSAKSETHSESFTSESEPNIEAIISKREPNHEPFPVTKSEPNTINNNNNTSQSAEKQGWKSKVVKPISFSSDGKPDKEVEPICLSSDGESNEADPICLSSDGESIEEVHKCNAPGRQPSLDCTICRNEMFFPLEVHRHPFVPGIGVCTNCYNHVIKARFTTDSEGYEEQCRWCCDGLDAMEVATVAMCGQCERVFCQDCIVRNFGHKNGWVPILEDDDWVCFCCNPLPLCVRINEFIAFRKSVAGSETKLFNPAQKSRASNATSKENDNTTQLNKSIKRPIQHMDKALKRTVDGLRLCDSGEYACAAKKFKKALS